MPLRWIDRAVEATVAFLVAVNAVIVCVNVFYRYVLASGISWANEIPGFLLVWIGFLGAYLAVRRGGHINFDLLAARLAPGRRKMLATLTDLLVAGFFGLLLVLSVRMIGIVGGTEIETLEIPRGVFLAVLPIASALLLLALAAGIVQRHRKD